MAVNVLKASLYSLNLTAKCCQFAPHMPYCSRGRSVCIPRIGRIYLMSVVSALTTVVVGL